MLSDVVKTSTPRRLAVVVNAASGGVGPDAASVIERLVAERGLEAKMFAPEAGEIEGAVRAAVESAPDLLVVLAGDGTARLAADLCGPAGLPLAPLPGGTLNMLPHALYGKRSWREALIATLDDGVDRTVGGGRIGGHAFYVAAILGSPALWGHAREALRAGNVRASLRWAVFALRRAFSGRVNYALEDAPRRVAGALVLICPLVSKAVDAEVALEAAALQMRSAQEAFRLAFNGLVSDWRRDPGVTIGLCRQGRAWARRSIPAILDGEIVRLPKGVDFMFEPCAFRARVPAPAGDAASGKADL